MKRPRIDVERHFAILLAAALAGERCPRNTPHGPLAGDAITFLVRAGRIRSEVYDKNYRVVTILAGEHAGRSTAPHPGGGKPFRVDGRLVRHDPTSLADRTAGTSAPISLPPVAFGRGGQ